jgi:hypothetical protein
MGFCHHGAKHPGSTKCQAYLRISRPTLLHEFIRNQSMGTAGSVAPAEQVLFLTDENLYLDRVGRVPQESSGETLQARYNTPVPASTTSHS